MADLFPPLVTAQIDDKPKVDEKVDYSNLPCPVPYDELHREAYSSVHHYLLLLDLDFCFFFLKYLNPCGRSDLCCLEWSSLEDECGFSAFDYWLRDLASVLSLIAFFLSMNHLEVLRFCKLYSVIEIGLSVWVHIQILIGFFGFYICLDRVRFVAT